MTQTESQQNRAVATRVIQALFESGHKETLSGRHHTLYDIYPTKTSSLTKVKGIKSKDLEAIHKMARPIVDQLYKLGERKVEICIGVCVYVLKCIVCVCGMCVYVGVSMGLFLHIGVYVCSCIYVSIIDVFVCVQAPALLSDGLNGLSFIVIVDDSDPPEVSKALNDSARLLLFCSIPPLNSVLKKDRGKDEKAEYDQQVTYTYHIQQSILDNQSIMCIINNQ
jgi:hypothetical protein